MLLERSKMLRQNQKREQTCFGSAGSSFSFLYFFNSLLLNSTQLLNALQGPRLLLYTHKSDSHTHKAKQFDSDTAKKNKIKNNTPDRAARSAKAELPPNHELPPLPEADEPPKPELPPLPKAEAPRPKLPPNHELPPKPELPPS